MWTFLSIGTMSLGLEVANKTGGHNGQLRWQQQLCWELNSWSVPGAQERMGAWHPKPIKILCSFEENRKIGLFLLFYWSILSHINRFTVFEVFCNCSLDPWFHLSPERGNVSEYKWHQKNRCQEMVEQSHLQMPWGKEVDSWAICPLQLQSAKSQPSSYWNSEAPLFANLYRSFSTEQNKRKSHWKYLKDFLYKNKVTVCTFASPFIFP